MDSNPERGRLYLDTLSVVNSEGVELPDVAELLCGLERRRDSSGRDRVDHRPGSHDDRANAVAGLCSLLKATVEFAWAMARPAPGTLRADYSRPSRPRLGHLRQ
jgi:hypothetical protein